jgi:hypothetical protein
MVIKFGGIRCGILFICNMHLRLQQSPIFERTARMINNKKNGGNGKPTSAPPFGNPIAQFIVGDQRYVIKLLGVSRVLNFIKFFWDRERLRNVIVKMSCNIPLNKFDTQSWHTSEGPRVGLNVHFVPSKIWLNASLQKVINGKFHN